MKAKINALKHTRNSETQLKYWQKILNKMKRNNLQIIEL